MDVLAEARLLVYVDPYVSGLEGWEEGRTCLPPRSGGVLGLTSDMSHTCPTHVWLDAVPRAEVGAGLDALARWFVPRSVGLDIMVRVLHNPSGGDKLRL